MLAKEKYGLRGRELSDHEAEFVPFTAQTRMSGVNLNGFEIRKGAADAIAEVRRSRTATSSRARSGHGREDRPLRRHAAGRRREDARRARA